MKTSLLKKISKKYDGPKYVYNLNEISHSYSSLKKSLPTFSKLYYSMKANPNEGVVNYLHKLGAGIECSSWGEISKALKSGVNKKNIIFTGPAKKNGELVQFIKKKVGIISIESLNEFKRVSSLSKKLNKNIDCIIRINPENMEINSSIKMMGVSSQFGIDSKKFLQNYKLFNSSKTNILGFHFYSASNVISNKDLLKIFFNCIDLSLKIEKLLKIKIKLLNLGGGFASPYGRKGKRKNYSNIKKPLEKKLINSFGEERIKSLDLIFESGRYLVGTCGGLICKVIDKKISKNKKYIILDSGINNLAGMSSINRLPKLDPEIVLINRKEKKKETFDIVGPLCTPLDFWSRSALSYKLKINDVLFVPNVSSYGLSASLVLFLSHDIPNELLLLNNKIFKTYKHYLNYKN